MFSQIQGRLVKIRMLPSVDVICLRIGHGLIHIFIMNKRKEKECTGKGVVRFLN